MKDLELLEICEKYLDYNPKTGVITWKVTRGSRVVGDLAGSPNNRGYLQIKLNRVSYKAHRLAFLICNKFLPPSIDHINGIKDDNRIINLRGCTQSENCRNTKTRSDNTSGYKGVYWVKALSKWTATVQVNKKRTTVGYFSCKHKAAEAYNEAAIIYYGEFAKINVIPELFQQAKLQGRIMTLNHSTEARG